MTTSKRFWIGSLYQSAAIMYVDKDGRYDYCHPDQPARRLWKTRGGAERALAKIEVGPAKSWGRWFVYEKQETTDVRL
ncbi:hypothetical protein LCGC14_0235630 [marine sediment metagenome]|uniref:Uncharacterized protein n=1 Tax=marine sediment metagenome TaxID=412755 RepID=A0A0F9UQB3_9ZZZZ